MLERTGVLESTQQCLGDSDGKQLFFVKFLKIFIYLFIYLFIVEKGVGREKEREGNINVWLPLAHPQLGTWPATQACALTGSQTSDPLVYRLVSIH